MAGIPPTGALPVPPVIPFLLFQGQNAILDLAGSDQDIKLYHKAILPNVVAIKYDFKSEDIKSFLESVRVRAKLYGWMDILDVPDTTGLVLSKVDQNGNISMDECCTHATIYMAARNRNTQNLVMLYQFLLNSMEEKWRTTLLSKMFL
jgi:hypothetical protein